jgi:hypothetical protein
LNVVEHLGDRVPLHDVGDVVPLLAQANVNRVRVAEEVVQVPQDFLVRAVQEEPHEIRLVDFERMHLENRFHVFTVDEMVDRPVAVAG